MSWQEGHLISRPCLPPTHPQTLGCKCPVCKRGWMDREVRAGAWGECNRVVAPQCSGVRKPGFKSQLTMYQPGVTQVMETPTPQASSL